MSEHLLPTLRIPETFTEVTTRQEHQGTTPVTVTRHHPGTDPKYGGELKRPGSDGDSRYLNRPDFRSVLQARMEHDEQEVFAGDA